MKIMKQLFFYSHKLALFSFKW